MMVAVVLQISQTTVNCGFSRIHALNQELWIQFYNGSGAKLIPRLRFYLIHAAPDFFETALLVEKHNASRLKQSGSVQYRSRWSQQTVANRHFTH
jgi:hypothetical protein